MTGYKKFKQDETGTAAIEFAILAPVLLLVLAGVVNIGLAINWRIAAEARVSDIANYIILESLEGGFTEAEKNMAEQRLSETPIQAYSADNEEYQIVHVISEDESEPDYVNVTVTNSSPLTLISGFSFDITTLQVRATIRIN